MEKDTPLRKILIIDDILGNIKILNEFLKPDYDVSYVTSGSLAVETALRERPDLILLDIMMPDMDGYEVCRRLKAEAELGDVPVIFLTAMDDSDAVLKGFDLGAVDYVAKPYYPAELLTRISTHLKLKESREIIAQKNQRLAELIQILCHDFMTPVSFAIGSLDLIRENPKMFDVFEGDIYNSLINASNLIEMVRAMRVQEDLNQSLNVEPIGLKVSVDKALMLLQHRLSKKRITLKKSIPDDYTVVAEETSLINSVINNILTNAIKFSYPDSTISISAKEENNRIILEIADQGIGMSPIMLGDLFLITRTTSRKGTEGEAGTGYGMLLIKKFVEEYGAEIGITSISEQTNPNEHGTVVRISFNKA